MIKDSCRHDVLVDLETNTVKNVVHPVEGMPAIREGRRDKFRAIGKNLIDDFIREDFTQSLRERLEAGVNLRCGEGWTRRQLIEHTTMLVEVGIGCPEIPQIVYQTHHAKIESILTTRWFKDCLQLYESFSDEKKEVNSAIRHLWYALRGYRVSKERQVYICPALEQLVNFSTDDERLLLIAERLLFYFGQADLSDAIQFIQNEDIILQRDAHHLNARLLYLFTNGNLPSLPLP